MRGAWRSSVSPNPVDQHPCQGGPAPRHGLRTWARARLPRSGATCTGGCVEIAPLALEQRDWVFYCCCREGGGVSLLDLIKMVHPCVSAKCSFLRSIVSSQDGVLNPLLPPLTKYRLLWRNSLHVMPGPQPSASKKSRCPCLTV